jgi:hypothetical protein
MIVHVGSLEGEAAKAAERGAALGAAQSVINGSTPCAKVDQKSVLDNLDPSTDAALIQRFKEECARQASQASGRPLGGPALAAGTPGRTLAWIAGLGAAAYVLYKIWPKLVA